MLHAMLNRATMRVAETTEVSGRVTAHSIKHELCAKTQSSLWRLTIFGFCKVCSLVAVTLILPALAYAQNNQGNGPGINPGVPNGTYVFTESGYLVAPPPPGITGQVPVTSVGRTTYFPDGTVSGIATFSFGGEVFSVTFIGTFTVNKDGSVSATTTSSPGGEVNRFIAYPTPDGNTIVTIDIDPGNILSGVQTRGR